MALIDWVAFCVPIIVVLIIAAIAKKNSKSVADYMAGGRCAGRYMLCVARGEMQAGAVMFAAFFEIFSRAGFTYLWWTWMLTPALMLVAITGFVFYRYRETKALTLAQFFEMRYSRHFRVFSGILGFFAGIMNFGIIPAVGARFFVYFLALPSNLSFLGMAIPTFMPIMAVMMIVTLYLTVSGGQVTVMITDCTSGLIDMWLTVVIVIGLILLFSWSDISSVMLDRPIGQSLMNPLNSMQMNEFDLEFVIMGLVLSIYGTMAWQNSSAYNAAACNPHESRMGSILGRWKEYTRLLLVSILAMCAVTFLNHSFYASEAAPIHDILNGIANPQIQKQMAVPTALSVMIPAGLKGLLCAILLGGIWAGDTTHIHSWGSIFVQDVLLPFRRKPLSTAQHIRCLRLTMIAVGVFAFLFGSVFSQTEYIAMWFRVTMGIYIGGAGAVIIGGLYWKKGTTAGAWAAMLTGSILSLGGIIVRQINPDFILNGMQLSFAAMLASIAVYITVSLLTCREDFNLDRMLHRGQYSIPDANNNSKASAVHRRVPFWEKAVGITPQFSWIDRVIAHGVFGWSVFWVLVMIAGTVWNLIAPWSDRVWSRFWWWAGVVLPLGAGLVTTVWFTGGVLRDMGRFFSQSKAQQEDVGDDGSVCKLSQQN